MASKRKEVISTAQRQEKKAKKDPEATKLNAQLLEISTAIRAAPITPEVEKMLESVLLLSLAEFSDRRHRFQEEAVTAVAGLLDEAEATLRKEVADKASQRDAAAGEKALRESESQEAEKKLEAKIAEVHRFKVVVAEKALAFRAATAALVEAEEAKRVDGRKVQEAEKKGSDIELALECLNALKELLPETPEAATKQNSLLMLLKKYKFEDSMMTALPAALAKAPEARGQFDLMAMRELEAVIGKLNEEQKDIIAAAVPMQEKCEAAVKAAQERLATARAEQRAAARDFDAASEEQSTSEAVNAATKETLRDLSQLSKRLERDVTNAEVEMEVFEQGPRGTFKELRERTAPVEAAAAADVEEMTEVQATETASVIAS